MMSEQQTDNRRGAVLHGMFELADGVSEPEFAAAFAAYFTHLQQKGFALSYRIMRRKPLEGFGMPLPGFAHYAAIEFADLDHEQACYDYARRTPSRFAHRTRR
jgi:hypothetical protein